ncbi:hypothetical protein [Streptomyces sp. NPDC056670]|uniref:hypothetical protein n=1 Tax=Streptomyces sp. NPDC056670 TaxID=3345904 RepID=UPI0036B1FEF9
MSDNQPDETSTDNAPAPKAAAQPVAKEVGRQTLETKHIQGQVITHTIVKPTRND